ncbi:MAG: transglycosylase SLT domain-containing protein [Casimicrobiaceae bacterium]
MIFRFILGVVAGACLAASCSSHGQVPRDAEKYRREITRNARLVFGLNAPIAALSGQIEQESGWNELATSRAGAQGLAQFMPATGRDMADKLGDGTPQPYNAAWALRAHSRYMKDLLDRVAYFDECNSFGAALSAYNGGLSRVNRRQTLADDPFDFWQSVRMVNPGVTEASQRENSDYPQRIVYMRQPHYVTWGRTVCLTPPKVSARQ